MVHALAHANEVAWEQRLFFLFFFTFIIFLICLHIEYDLNLLCTHYAEFGKRASMDRFEYSHDSCSKISFVFHLNYSDHM